MMMDLYGSSMQERVLIACDCCRYANSLATIFLEDMTTTVYVAFSWPFVKQQS